MYIFRNSKPHVLFVYILMNSMIAAQLFFFLVFLSIVFFVCLPSRRDYVLQRNRDFVELNARANISRINFAEISRSCPCASVAEQSSHKLSRSNLRMCIIK